MAPRSTQAPLATTAALPPLSEEHRDHVRGEATAGTYRDLGLVGDQASTATLDALTGTLASAYRATDIPPALAQAASAGTLEELTDRLRAAATRTRTHHTQEKDANTAVADLAMSLLVYEATPGIHHTLGIHHTTWRRRITTRLDVTNTWYDTATPTALAERAKAVGVAHHPQAREQLPAAVEELLAVQARWVGARRVRDVLIRHLYPNPLNQPAVQALTGLTQAQIWQILNPGYRSKAKNPDT